MSLPEALEYLGNRCVGPVLYFGIEVDERPVELFRCGAANRRLSAAGEPNQDDVRPHYCRR
jgi:hypothetical protein